MKKSIALSAVLFILLAGLLAGRTATADVSIGLYLDGLFLELGGRPGFRPHHPGYRGYYGYQRPPYNYYDYRYRPKYGRPPYYYDRHYYPPRPPYRAYQWHQPGWRGDPRFNPPYRRY